MEKLIGCYGRRVTVLTEELNLDQIFNCVECRLSKHSSLSTMDILRGGVKKNCEKAVRLTAWVDPPSSPPLKRSGKCEISRQVAIFGVILPFYIGQKWVKIFTNRSGQAGGEVTPPPPQSGQPDRFFPVFFFTPSLLKTVAPKKKLYLWSFTITPGTTPPLLKYIISPNGELIGE